MLEGGQVPVFGFPKGAQDLELQRYYPTNPLQAVFVQQLLKNARACF